ncbi:PAS domain-containing protein [Parerythrobacter jejuensis]|uniref:PAS domain-containing protein n=1 Tax=Parerythrobacter jejuensis TaxID=795812 RepID=A0A845AW66_9SPHN|nr:hypothetical protein [Parerythrobacter jejuensis]MXP31019.1 hypothetical protein [Parerythrobacter jejuensis]MXP33779.1 hypothetical protein [Parerythrobacter jejuensis]
MDTLRGNFGSFEEDSLNDDYGEDDISREAPPSPVGQDERRMQVRAYNHWASLLQDRNFPSIEDLAPDELPDFGPYSVLLDFTSGIENPAIHYLGDQLATECGAEAPIETLDDVPSRSLLSRITDHYMQILANQAPIGFEAEFVNQRGATILYRGILLPFSSDDDTIDFIYGVINWKETADQLTTDELLLEIDQALEEEAEAAAMRTPDPVTDWADGPSVDAVSANDDQPQDDEEEGIDAGSLGLTGLRNKPNKKPLDLSTPVDLAPLPGAEADDLPMPSFGMEDAGLDDLLESDFDIVPEETADDWSTPVGEQISDHPDSPVLATSDTPDSEAAAEDASIAIAEPSDAGELGLHDCLASARELAQAARSSEDRSRAALYAAVGRAYDVSIAAEEEPDDFDELVAESGLTVQDRAPMTPVVKLVFGAEYDKTRLTEYAAVLSHAHRVGVERGSLAGFLSRAEGGLKGVVQAERRLRREESGKPVEAIDAPKEALAKKLRAIEPKAFEDLDRDGAEFGVVMIRRLETGEIVIVGEVSDDVPLIERVGRKLVG